MESFRKLILLFLIQVYAFSVLFYTIFGVLKSGNEYFCLQKRPDVPDYTDEIVTPWLNISFVYEGRPIGLFPINGKVLTMNSSDNIVYNHTYGLGIYRSFKTYTPVESADNVQTINYKLGVGYFVVNCKFERADKNGNKNEYINVKSESLPIFEEQAYIDFNGRFDRSSRQDTLAWVNSTDAGFLRCKLEKSPETCTTSAYYTNMAFKIYFVLLAILSAILVSSGLPMGRYFSRRIIYKIKSMLEVDDFQLFCNPVNGKPSYMKKGDQSYMLSSDRSGFCFYGEKLRSFSDLRGSYGFTESNKFYIKTVEYSGLFECTAETLSIITSYFYDVTMNPCYCAVRSDGQHYLDTKEVLIHILKGGGLDLYEYAEDTTVLDVKFFEFNYIKNLYNISDKIAMLILEHNWLFFKGSYNIKALDNCLRRKTWSSDSPSNVGNSQWKYYTSDFAQLMRKQGNCVFKCQKIYNMTDSLKKALNSEDKLEVKKPEGTLVLNSDKALKKLSSLVIQDARCLISEDCHLKNTKIKTKMSEVCETEIPEYKEDCEKFLKNLESDILSLNDNLHGRFKYGTGETSKQVKKVSLREQTDAKIDKMVQYNKKVLSTFMNYRDVLLNPPEILIKADHNEASVLRKKIKNCIRRNDKMEELKLNHKLEDVMSDRILKPHHRELTSKISESKIINNVLMNHIKIKIYDDILSLLNEDEIRSDMEVESVKWTKEVKKSDVYNKLDSDKSVCKKISYKVSKQKYKKGKKKQAAGAPNKSLLKLNKNIIIPKSGLISNDFDKHFELAVKDVGVLMVGDGEACSKELEDDQKMKCRPRSIQMLKRFIKRSVNSLTGVESTINTCLPKLKLKTYDKLMAVLRGYNRMLEGSIKQSLIETGLLEMYFVISDCKAF